MPLPEQLERHLGARLEQERDRTAKLMAQECPPVSPLLIEHLKQRFRPGYEIKPNHPQLQQLLLVQYGCDLVLDYLKRHYDFQSSEARKAREV